MSALDQFLPPLIQWEVLTFDSFFHSYSLFFSLSLFRGLNESKAFRRWEEASLQSSQSKGLIKGPSQGNQSLVFPLNFSITELMKRTRAARVRSQRAAWGGDSCTLHRKVLWAGEMVDVITPPLIEEKEIKILSSFTHPHVVPNLYVFLSFCATQKEKFWGIMLVAVSHVIPVNGNWSIHTWKMVQKHHKYDTLTFQHLGSVRYFVFKEINVNSARMH